MERRGKEPKQVKDLILDNTHATQIEGLTDEYTALESLSLINVGLTSLKGFPKLPNLRKLELSDNRISNGLIVLKDCPKLSHLNLSGNKIRDLEALEQLKSFDALTHLDLFNNDICNLEDYRAKVFKLLPSLKYLDDTDADENEEDAEDDSDGERNGTLSDEEDEEDEDEESEEASDDGDDGLGLAAIYNDNLEDDEDGDFDEEDAGEEDDDDEIDEEEPEEEPRGKRRRVEDSEADGTEAANNDGIGGS